METIYSEKLAAYNISYPQIRQQWFPACIFPLKQLIGLTGNRPQYASAYSFQRYL
jgi:hypothetical protein